MKTRFLAGSLATLWAGFWGYFATMAILFEPGDTPTRLKVASFVVALMSSALWSAWTHKRAGGIWLCMVGTGLSVVSVAYLQNPLATRLFLFFTLALPPLVAGLMKCYAARSAGRADVAAAQK